MGYMVLNVFMKMNSKAHAVQPPHTPTQHAHSPKGNMAKLLALTQTQQPTL